MSGKWPGGVISKTAPTVTGPTDGEGGSASGIWTLDQAADYEKQGLWPKPTIPRELWMWGKNQFGQIGQGNTHIDYSSPVQVGALTNWLTISCGPYYSLLTTKSDGTAWAWGNGASGMLGQGSTLSYSSPVQIGALTDWTNPLSVGFYSPSGGIKSDGTLWLWGTGSYGQLGQGNTTSYSSPVQVGALTTWLQFAGGYYYGGAIRTDNTLWMWGRNNNYGQGGHNNLTNYSSPKQVGALSDWVQLACGYRHAAAVKTDGTLWCWGDNGSGELGDGTSTNRSSPVQVGALTNWSSVTCGAAFTCAIKTDGTLWTWGAGGSGQLGHNNTTSISSPAQVGALTTWSSVSGRGRFFAAALKTDGTLWAWGENGSGELAQGDTTDRSSPVQVGALTTWKALAAGRKFMGAFK